MNSMTKQLEAVLKCIEDNGVTLNNDKCEFAKERIQFLGQLIGKDGIEKISTNISALCQFLGMVNQMGEYLPNLAQTSKPRRPFQ